MLDRIRQRSRDESGFTLVELLVVMLILGILAAIAVPSFFNQREKAQDADAKSLARTAQTAMETYYTDNGTYAAADADALEAIEQTLVNADLNGDGTFAATEFVVTDAGGSGTPDGDSYQVRVYSDTANWFAVNKTDTGVTTQPCGPTGGVAGCPTDTDWGD